MRQDMAWQQQLRSMNYFYPGGSDDAIAPLPALIRVYAADGGAEGMGVWYALGGKEDPKPKLSWVELAGKRYLPEETDSIYVWDLPGFPVGSNWAFVMATGPVEAYALHPAEGPRFYIRPGGDASARRNESKWKPIDSLWYRLPWRFGKMARKGEPTMAIRLANTEGGERLLEIAEELERLCRDKRFARVDSLIGEAGRIADYPLLQYQIGICRERQGRREEALGAFRRAACFAAMDSDFRKNAEGKIRNIEAEPRQ